MWLVDLITLCMSLSAMCHIASCFSQISNESNWMHLKYQTKLQAKKALSKNGRVFSGRFMIGVQACIDKQVMTQGFDLHDEPVIAGTALQSAALAEPCLNASLKLNASMRSLVAHRPGVNETLLEQVRILAMLFVFI